MSKASRTVLALVVGAGLLAAVAWFDAVLLLEAQQRGRATFDTAEAAIYVSLGSFAIAGSILLLARLAIRSGSLAVGVIYTVVGGFFALLPWILSTFATYRNDVPPLLPDQLAVAVAQIYTTAVGPLSAVVVLGAGMAIAGIAVTVRTLREPDVRP